MPHICVDSPLPTISGIMASFSPLLTFPPSVPSLGQLLPTLPSPLFPGISMPNLELVTTAIDLQSAQILTTAMAMIQPITTFLGSELSSELPSIPGLGSLNLVDLLSGDPDALISAVKQAIAEGLSSLWSFVPSPLFPTLSIPSIEIPYTLSLIIKQYQTMLATKLSALVKSVTDSLTIPGMPSIPTIPTIAQIQAAIFSLIPGADNFSMVVAAMRNPGFSISSVLSQIALPGLPSMPALPLPLIPSLSMPDVEFVASMTAFYSNIVVGLFSPIINFVQSTLSSYMGFSFPLLCITI